jgi:hypothetical protein
MTDIPPEAVAAAADLLTEAMTVTGETPSPGELAANAGLALLMVEAAEPHLAYAAGKAAGAGIVQLEQLAAAILATFVKRDDGHRARAGQVQIAKWQAILRGDDDS